MAQDCPFHHVSRNAHKELRMGDDFYDIFKKYFCSSLSSTAASVAEAISGLVSVSSKKEDVDNRVWDTWSNIFQVAQQISYNDPAQEKLTKLVAALKGLGPSHNGVDWEDLPQLGWTIRDWYNFSPGPGKTESEEVLNAWVNLNSFWARLGRDGLHDTTDIAIWTLRQGLEEDESQAVPELLECRTLAAIQYIAHQGSRLYERMTSGETPQENEARKFKGGAKFEGETGLSKKRWEFWTMRLNELGDHMSTGERKELAQKATGLMESLNRL